MPKKPSKRVNPGVKSIVITMRFNAVEMQTLIAKSVVYARTLGLVKPDHSKLIRAAVLAFNPKLEVK